MIIFSLAMMGQHRIDLTDRCRELVDSALLNNEPRLVTYFSVYTPAVHYRHFYEGHDDDEGGLEILRVACGGEGACGGGGSLALTTPITTG